MRKAILLQNSHSRVQELEGMNSDLTKEDEILHTLESVIIRRPLPIMK